MMLGVYIDIPPPTDAATTTTAVGTAPTDLAVEDDAAFPWPIVLGVALAVAIAAVVLVLRHRERD